MDILEAITDRRSVRSYDPAGLTPGQRAMLMDAVAEAYTPFQSDVTIALRHFDLTGPYRPSTYGVIKGASDFFLVGFGDSDEAALSAGFMFEQVVLKAVQLGLGTCWIAATFNGQVFERSASMPCGQQLRIISPVGVARGRSFFGSVTEIALGSRKRKPFESLFFEGSFSHPASGQGRFGQSLSMMRLAPSSTNSQPWRALVAGDGEVHFYSVAHRRLSMVDCGIGLCHFWVTERHLGHNGHFIRLADAPSAPSRWHYVATYRTAP